MEQTSRVGLPAPEATPIAAAAELAAGDETLREELAKWRERVPKLAAALRQRAEEAEALKQELERLRRVHGTGEAAPAGIRARDELIEELECKLAELADRHKGAQGELHKRQLAIEELQSDVDAWKGKWQSVTRSLDAQAAEVSDRDQRSLGLEADNESLRRRLAEQVAAHEAVQRVLDEAVEERDSLRSRNDQLFETTELANRQIGSLSDSLTELRANLKQYREREADVNARHEASQQELETLRLLFANAEQTARQQATELATATAAAEASGQRITDLEQQLREAVDAGGRAEQLVSALTEELHMVCVAAASSVRSSVTADVRVAEADQARQAAQQKLAEVEQGRAELQASLDEQCREVQRLTGMVERAQRVTAEREDERRVLSEQLQALESRCQHIEQQLGERSVLVVTLEQDQAEAAKRLGTLEQERAELEEALIRAERHAKESAEHVTQLNDKLERQKDLMLSLEEELAEAGEEHRRTGHQRTDGARDTDSSGAEIEVVRLQEQVRKLEGLVRERTNALNRLEWQREVSAAAAQPAGEPAEDCDKQPVDDADGKLLLVLNQQLNAARMRNDELLGRIRELERQVSEGTRRYPGDDLTRIHGVGQKLAEQLNDLGIYHYQQIAELDEGDLCDEGHVLHGHRGRILRDAWIEQAVKLISH